MRTGVDDNGSNDRRRREIDGIVDDYHDAIVEGLRNCAMLVSITIRSKYLNGPRPVRLVSNVGKARPTGQRGGGKLERSLVLGGGFEALMGSGDQILKLTGSKKTIGLEFGTQVKSDSGFPYPSYWENMTGPKIIEPIRKKVLSWVSAGGKRVFAKRVVHKGPRKFMEPAVQDASPKYPSIIEEALEKVHKKDAA